MLGLLRRRVTTPVLRTPLGDVAVHHVRDPGRRAPLLVVLHGYGADASQVASLLPIATARPSHLVAPEAFLEVRDGGRAWFPVGLHDGRPYAEPEQVELALDRLDAMLVALHERHCGPGDPLVLIGYSQGASVVLEWLSRPRVAPVTHAAAFAGTPVLPRSEDGPRPAMPVFVANGTHDPVITAADHHEAVQRMAALGHVVTERRDPVPHVVSRAALRGLAQWLDADSRLRA